MFSEGLEHTLKKVIRACRNGEVFHAELAKTVGIALAMVVGIELLESVLSPWMFKTVGLSYVFFLPIWYAARRGGRVAGFFAALMVATVMAFSSTASWPFVAWLLNLAVLTLVMAFFQQLEERIQTVNRAANTDSLTGVLNRSAFTHQAKRALIKTMREYSSACVVLVDCNRFKEINDRHGHMAGDEALRIVARAMRDAGQGDDVIGRLGGDEFVALLADTDGIGANLYVNRLRGILSRTSQDLNFELTVSAGIAYFGDDGRTLDQLVAVADEKMYRNKQMSKAIVDLKSIGTQNVV